MEADLVPYSLCHAPESRAESPCIAVNIADTSLNLCLSDVLRRTFSYSGVLPSTLSGFTFAAFPRVLALFASRERKSGTVYEYSEPRMGFMMLYLHRRVGSSEDIPLQSNWRAGGPGSLQH